MDVERSFRPGHPLAFWTFVLVFVYASLSASRAAVNVNDCRGVGDGSKHWRVLPPEWVCGHGGMELTRPR
jgi:hypothetical protein